MIHHLPLVCNYWGRNVFKWVHSQSDQGETEPSRQCLRCHFSECSCDSRKLGEHTVHLNASSQSFSRGLFNLACLPFSYFALFPPTSLRRDRARSCRGREKRIRFSCRSAGAHGVRQINTPADPMAHPPLCRSSPSRRSSRFPFLQVIAPWLQITSATLRWSAGTRPSG